MVFSSHLFLFYFLPCALVVYYVLPAGRLRTGWLTLCSYVFYAWAHPPWAIIMFVSTLVDYLCGVVLLKLARLRRNPDGTWPVIPPEVPRTRAMLVVLIVSLVTNLLLLGFFKYYNFTAENLNRVALALGGVEWVPVLSVVLPVGISFYTFQSMSYCIDVYRGDARPMTNFLDFCCFETLFPQLVAGPIVRYADIAEQLRERSHTPAKFARGIAFFSLGLAKKVLIANPLAHIADGSFDAASRSALEAWLGLFAYSFQLYFDFSGYSDMAVGLGLMFGFVFIKNFDAPYQAQSITEFWRRWHISLSTWLRDYLYIPLGGNRQGTARTYFNLLTVMLLGGFWHGASWNFLIWGGIHGGMLALERALAIGQQRSPSAWIGALRNTATFVIVSLAWVFFRADDLPSAIAYLGSLVGLSDSAAGSAILSAVLFTPYHTSMLILAALIVWLAPQTWEFTHRITTVRAAACLIVLVLSVMLMWTQTDNPFLYFQF